MSRPGEPRRPRGRRDEHGSATVDLLAVVVLLTATAAGVAAFAALAAAKHRATAAADLAALAAASSPARGCAVAGLTARRNGARLTRCTRVGPDVTVTVEVLAEHVLGMRHALTTEARAGPAR